MTALSMQSASLSQGTHPTATESKAILFDLDGTLLDTAPDLVAAVNDLRKEYDLPPLAFDIALSMVGKGAHNLIQRALTHEHALTLDETFDMNLAYAHFAEHYHRINGHATREYAGVSDVLRALHAQGHRLGIVTNKPTEFTLPLIQQFGWSDLFSSVVCGDTLSVRKPQPEPLYHALAEMDSTSGSALMVGDSMNDALAAQAAQCACVILDYGYNEGQPVREALKDWPHVPVYSDFTSALRSFLP